MLRRRKNISSHSLLFSAIGFWLVLFLTSANFARASTLSDLAASMQPGTWAKLATNNIVTALTSADWGSGASNNILYYSDDLVWDQTSRQALFSGGDHNWDIPTTVKFVKYVEATNSWVEIGVPPWARGVMHGYDHSAIDQAKGIFYHRPYNTQTVHRYNIATQTWDQPAMATFPYISDYNNCCDALEYFPELGGVVWVSGSGNLYLYKDSTNQWSRIAGNLALGGTWHLAEYNHVHKVMIFYSNATGALYKMSSTGAVTRLKNPPVSLYNGSNGLLTVDPVSGDYIALTGSSLQPYKYDVLTDTWQALSAVNQPSFSGNGVVAAPINTYGVIFFATCADGGGSCTVYLYKHAANPSTPAPSTPAPSVSISASPASVISGSVSTLTWSSTNASSCTASGGWSGTKAISGSQTTGNLTGNTTFTLTCTGTVGSSSQSATVAVTSSTTPTTISTNIADGVVLSGSVIWSANPSGSPVRVEFLIDGAVLWTELSSPYQFNGDPSGTLSTTTLTNGSHQLKVRAVYADNSIAERTSAVTVSNTSPPSSSPPTTPPSSSGAIGGYPMPSLQNEKDAYVSWGWSWTANKEPGAVTEPIANYTVSNPDIHGDTEGDDLWTYLMMYRRTGNTVYLNRATAWARFLKNDYRNCVGSSSQNFCDDRDSFGLDHFYGWGLIALYEHNGDIAAVTEAENLGAVLETMYAPSSPYGCLPRGACIWYGPRAGARHLLFMTRLAQVTGKTRWINLRDQIIGLWLTSAQWDSTYGTYFVGDYVTDEVGGPGAFASGLRVQSPFQIGILSEAFDYAYRATGNPELQNRMIAMARFVDRYGLDPAYQYTASWFGIKNGQVWHKYSATSPVTFWDPSYTTALVNILVRGYKYTGDVTLYNRAKHFFNRGTKGIYGSTSQRQAADNIVGHFVDTIFASSTGDFYLEYNKGELQYTYLIFENGGAPTVETTLTPPPTTAAPEAPSGLTVR